MQRIETCIKRHIKSVNNVLTDAHLSTLTNAQLLKNCHPIYRGDYATLLHNAGKITDSEKALFSTRRM